MKIVERARKIGAERPILKSLIIRDLKDRYGGAALGMLWSVINPCLIALAITFVFSFVMKSEIKNFPLFVLSGIFPWFFFSNSLNESAFTLRQNQDILNRFLMTKEIVPLSVTLSNLAHLVIGLIFMLPFFIFFNPGVAMNLLLLLPALFLFFVFTTGISMCISIMAVYNRDIPQLLGVGTMFLFWITPVFYSTGFVPGQYRWVVHFNPLYWFIRIFQALLYEGVPGHFYWWNMSLMLAAVSLAAGYAIFMAKENEVLKYL